MARRVAFFWIAFIAFLLVAVGCAPVAPGEEEVSTARGAQLWSQNCGRCHNFRDPKEFSDERWAVIVRHMRMRAALTGEEQRAITEFLQAANGQE